MLNLKKTLAEYGKKIQLLRGNNGNIAMKIIEIPHQSVPDGTDASPSLTEIDLEPYGITVSIYGVEAYLGTFKLPYVSNGKVSTWISYAGGKKIRIANSTTGWGSNYSLWLLVFYQNKI